MEHHQPLTSQAYAMVVLGASHHMLSRGQVLRLQHDSSIGFWSMGEELFWGKNGHEYPFKTLILPIEERYAQANACFIFQTRPLANQIHMEDEWNACVIHWMGTNSLYEHLHKFSCQNVQTTIGLSHLCICHCPIFLTTKNASTMREGESKS